MSTKLDFEVDRLLREAARILRAGEWGQGLNFGVWCMVSAMQEASYRTQGDSQAYWRALPRLGFASPLDGVHWNDEPGRTVGEVIARLEGAVRADVVGVSDGD